MTETTVSSRQSGLIAFLKRRLNPIAADRAEKFARLEARVASDSATGEHFNQLGDMKLEKALPEDALDLYKRACEQFVEEDLIVKAIAVAKKILKQFPDDVCVTEMYLKLGGLNQQRGMIANAKEAYLVAAQRYQEAGAIQDALRVFQKLADLLPDNHDLNADLARMYSKEGMSTESSAQFARTAVRLLKVGDHRQAKELCLASLAQKAGNRDALKALLQIALHEQDYKEADAYVSRLGAYIESDWELLKAYGDLLVRQERFDEAAAQYEKAVAINPMSQDLSAALDRLRGSHGAPPPQAPVEAAAEGEEPAVFDLDETSLSDFDPSQLAAAAQGDDSTDADSGVVELENYEEVFADDSQPSVAESGDGPGFDPSPVAASSGVDDADFQKRLAEAKFYEELGMEEEAKEVYAELLFSHSDHPGVLDAGRRLGLVESAEPQPEVTSATAAPVTPVSAGGGSSPDIADLLAEADIYVSGTLFTEAIQIYERILAEDPDQKEALAGLETARSLAADAGLYREEQAFENDIEQQMTHLLATLLGESDSDEEDPSLHLEMANSYLEMDLADEALAELKIVAAAPQPPAEMHLAFARCHAVRGDREAAVTSYEQFLEADANGKRADDGRYELAVLLLDLGRGAEARSHLQHLVHARPDFRDAKDLLAGIAVD